MDFDFSDDQQQLRDAVARWVDKGYTFERRQSIARQGGFSREVWNELAELGLTALTVPEQYGGLGQGAVDVMVVMEELGRGLVMEPLTQAFVASAVLSQFGDEALKQAWLPQIATGEKLVVLASQEHKARYRLDVCAGTATKTTNGYTVNATKNIVPVGDQADAFIVPAQLDGKIALFLVESGAEGLSTRGYATQDEGRAADLICKAAPATLITANGLTALTLAQDVANAALCAEGVGVMEQTLKLTAEYMNQRKQFGVVISSFQALRHRVADMKMQLELARSMSYYGTLKLGAPAEERHTAIARAKVQLGQAMRYVGQQSVQLHGGIGVTDEYAGSHYFKRLTQMEMTGGDTLHHLGIVSANMQDSAGVFA
ncbi:acyl-CoA dehydrogenase family protein [Comamonas resistens]|uniref:Acyl-CoA dehydrogenase family protein n=1 Tax=Comamonas resistens TaxID=3046670 RepID=A0ABY8STT9_9BURK|nr:acyl-CoA dehydrogenase family protein [Comamonas resistens]MDL5035482.1 acyl-CoA dehydrogenase family protein [Comamonas resistens]WHS66463.1 acyl-CoA dehydrogenase family protein [Comamonas resistens]